MPEPTTTAAASVAAAASGLTLALLGVDYHSLLYGLIGALIAVGQAQHTSRWRAVLSVVLSTVTGAVLGTVVVESRQDQGMPFSGPAMAPVRRSMPNLTPVSCLSCLPSAPPVSVS